MKGPRWNRLLWAVALALMAGLLWWGRADLSKVLTARPLPLVACFAFTAGIAMTGVARWRICLKSVGESGTIGIRSLFYYFMLGRVLGLVVPMEIGDFGARTLSLKAGHSVPIGRASYSVYLDRTFDVVVSAILLVPSALFILGVVGRDAGLAIGAGAFAAGLACFALLGRQTMELVVALFRLLLGAICKVPGIRTRVNARAEIEALECARHRSVAVKLYLLSGLKFLFTALRFGAVALAMDLGAGVADMVLFAPGAQFALVFSVTPGGLGVVDWSWLGLLLKIGVPRSDGVPYLVTQRISVLISVLVLAAVAKALHKRGSGERTQRDRGQQSGTE
ncbi:MAG: lysylphosphatidylglycerol synthase transmembrane domain-containing protein [bacterium]